MESFAFSITVVVAALLLVVIVQFIRERIAEMEETGEIGPKATVPETKNRTEPEDMPEYGAIDCFDDCLRAFKWQSKEEAECARACGLNNV